MTPEQHADYLFHNVPSETLTLVADALRVRAMDFVGDRLHDDGGDEAADAYRALEALGAVEALDLPFDPTFYGR